MKFSIIVPVYNAENYIDECCESVLRQSYQDYELLLINDGSSDGSGAICDEISRRLPEKCIVVHTPNQGPLLARRTGIRASTGDVFVFLDSDDCLRIDALEILADCFCKTDCDTILYNASDKKDFSNTYCGFPFHHLSCIEGNDKALLYATMVYDKIPNAVCLKAIKKQCMADWQDCTDFSFVRNGEDLLMSLYMLTAAQKIACLDESLYFYRQREGSIVHSFNPDRAESIKTVHREMERFIDMWGMPELHPAHYAREVHGWVETLLILLENKRSMEPEAFCQQLQSMAADPYFLRAYTSMDKKVLSRTYRPLAKWLRNKRFSFLHMAVMLKTLKSKVKNKK